MLLHHHCPSTSLEAAADKATPEFLYSAMGDPPPRAAPSNSYRPDPRPPPAFPRPPSTPRPLTRETCSIDPVPTLPSPGLAIPRPPSTCPPNTSPPSTPAPTVTASPLTPSPGFGRLIIHSRSMMEVRQASRIFDRSIIRYFKGVSHSNLKGILLQNNLAFHPYSPHLSFLPAISTAVSRLSELWLTLLLLLGLRPSSPAFALEQAALIWPNAWPIALLVESPESQSQTHR